MSSKNKTEVLIAGKIFTLSGYESEEYLQKVATYINNKIAEFKKLDGYNHQTKENKSIAQIQLENQEKDLEASRKENTELQKEVVRLQTERDERNRK